MNESRKRRVIVGITGSTAAPKAQSIVGALQMRDFEVRVAMTASAQQVITENPLRARCNIAPYVNMWAPRGAEGGETHVDWAEWADAMVIAPATASSLASLRHGFFDSPVTLLAGNIAPNRIFLAPAMSQMMWTYPATQENVATLQAWGMRVLGPVFGRVASGGEGQRLMEPKDIAANLDMQVSLS